MVTWSIKTLTITTHSRFGDRIKMRGMDRYSLVMSEYKERDGTMDRIRKLNEVGWRNCKTRFLEGQKTRLVWLGWQVACYDGGRAGGHKRQSLCVTLNISQEAGAPGSLQESCGRMGWLLSTRPKRNWGHSGKKRVRERYWSVMPSAKNDYCSGCVRGHRVTSLVEKWK